MLRVAPRHSGQSCAPPPQDQQFRLQRLARRSKTPPPWVGGMEGVALSAAGTQGRRSKTSPPWVGGLEGVTL